MEVSLSGITDRAIRELDGMLRAAQARKDAISIEDLIYEVANDYAPRDKATLLWLATEHPELLDCVPEAVEYSVTALNVLDEVVLEHIENALREHAREKGLLK